MKFNEIFKEFCDKNGYKGMYSYNEYTEEYQVVISKGENNAGAFLKPQEYHELGEEHLKKLLEMLDEGFNRKFN